jgi:pantetheine-phosphate adenylyltransferase
MTYEEIFDELRITYDGKGYFIPEVAELILDRWSEPHRHYHGLNHLSEILGLLKQNGFWFPESGYNVIMLYSAIFHDIVYDPTRNDNEEESIKIFSKWCGVGIDKLTEIQKEEIVNIIMDTKTGIPRTQLSACFIKYDRYNLFVGDFETILNKTMLLFKEYQFMDFKEWREKQIDFLFEYINENTNIKNVIEFLSMWKPKIGIYYGSFNKFHKGHLNILQKAEKIFDKVIIGRGINSDKNNEIYDLPETLKFHQIENYNGLLTDFIDSLGYETTLIRGLRNSTDLQFEMTQFQYLQDIKPDINIVNIFCDKQFEHISSSAIRSLEKFGKGSEYLT